MKRILIADDHDAVRAGLRAILERHVGWEIVAEARNGSEAVSAAVETRPDVAIVDYSMPLMSGVEVARGIKGHQLPTEILIFTVHDSNAVAWQAFQAGARAFLLKSDASKMLLAAVESLILHKPFYAGSFSERIEERGEREGRFERGAFAPREDDRQTGCGRAQQQGRERDPQSQHKDDGDPSGGRHAQAQHKFDRGPGSIRCSQQARGGVKQQRVCRRLASRHGLELTPWDDWLEKPMKQILIADDHEVVRTGLRAIIETRADWIVGGEAADGRQALELVSKLKPDVAIVDYSMPVMNGLEVCRRIKSDRLHTGVLILTMFENEEVLTDALLAGARGFLLKSDARYHLVAAVESLLDHQPYFTSAALEELLRNYLSTQKGQIGRGTHSAGAARRSTDCGRTHQQVHRCGPESEREDRRNPSRIGHAQAQCFIGRRIGAICHSSRIDSALKSCLPSQFANDVQS